MRKNRHFALLNNKREKDDRRKRMFNRVKASYLTGFTLIELLTVIGISVLLLAVSAPLYTKFYLSNQQDEAITQAISALRLAREYSIARFKNSSYGVYFSNLPEQEKFILFQGDSYANRNIDFDREKLFGKTLTASTTLSGNEVVFSKGLGEPGNMGKIYIIDNKGQTRIIDINNIGIIREE